jgi:ankyrin repeat protein
MSLLEVAVVGKHLPLINIFIRQNHISNFSIARQTALLTHAVVTEDLDIVELVIRHISDVTSQICAEALTSACRSGCSDIVGMLLDVCPDADPNSLLKRACLKADMKTVKVLLRAGATIHRSPDAGFIPSLWFKAATMPEVLSVCDALMADGGYVDWDSGESLQNAVFGGILPYVRAMLDRGSFYEGDVNRALTFSWLAGNVEVLELLFNSLNNCGARIYADMFPVFRDSLAYSHEAMALRLLSLFPETFRGKEQRALRLAVARSCINVVKVLMAYEDIDLNARESDGSTVLSAVSDPTIARMLLDAKAEVNPNSRDSVLYRACGKLCPETVRLLLEAGADANGTFCSVPILHCLMQRVCKDEEVAAKIEILELLIDAGAALEQPEPEPSPVKTVRAYSLSVLRECVGNWRDSQEPVIVRALLRGQARSECSYRDKVASLELALQSKHVDVIRVFLSEMSITTLLSTDSSFQWFSSVFYTSTAKESEYREVLRLVLSAGANVMEVDENGYTALMMAMGSGVYAFSDVAVKAFISDVIDHIRGVELV